MGQETFLLVSTWGKAEEKHLSGKDMAETYYRDIRTHKDRIDSNMETYNNMVTFDLKSQILNIQRVL